MRAVVIDIAVRITTQSIVALLLVVAAEAAAQGLPGAEGPVGMSMPSLALGLSPAGVRALNEDLDNDLRALDAFGKKPNMDRFKDGGYEKAKPWTMYGRLGVLNFQETLDPSRSEGGGNITFRRTGPKLTGRYYIGIHRTF